MSRLLLDANMPIGLRAVLHGQEVVTAFEMGWGRLTNGDLLTAAEADGFAALITADRNMRYQQNLVGRRIAIVVLQTNHWPTIRGSIQAVIEAVGQIEVGAYIHVALPGRRRRGRYSKPDDAPGS